MAEQTETFAQQPSSEQDDSQPLDQDVQRRWSAYYQAVAGRPPRDTLLAALTFFEEATPVQPRFAIDLGCGEGRDTIELLRVAGAFWHSTPIRKR